jgi:hypothetical protein
MFEVSVDSKRANAFTVLDDERDYGGVVDVIDDGVHEKHLEFDGGGVYQVNVFKRGIVFLSVLLAGFAQGGGGRGHPRAGRAGRWHAHRVQVGLC